MPTRENSDALVRIYGNPGTLYAKCGGVFGVAAFVDRCMDKWMSDPTLNANEAVTTWHQKAQRCGFKFLVVQIVCNLTGGPQVYTGRAMDEAHKHLNISEDEWGCFMEIFNDVCSEFGLAADIVDDLNALMISMEMDCVVYPGERVPVDRGPARPSGNSLYARMGGVYPIALFVDRLVDALLEDERVHIPVDAQKRNEVSVKYLFAELVCNICGGPEVVTAKAHDDTKLLLPQSEWRILIATAEVAADHLPLATRTGLIQVLESNKNHIVDLTTAHGAPANSPASVQAAAVKGLHAAAAGRMLSKEVIAARHAAPGAMVAARRRVLGDPRTLYGRGGGIFGLAKLADRMMDVWMANPVLNGNVKVARWHDSQQKFGFKFLVTQIMGYLTGGPQRYTGRPMDEAHKHLGITSQQWDVFMGDSLKVFREFRLDQGTQKELYGILSVYRTSCVLAPGETAPADPGLLRPTGTGSTLYQRLGGVYPIAQFVDRLVESVLTGDRVHIEYDQLSNPAGKRHPPGLKYMLTELVCSGTGGSEVVTSKGFDEAKLGVKIEEWPMFLELATEAAAIWPIPYLRRCVVAALGAVKSEICVGIVEEEDSPGAAARRKVQDAGFDHYLSSAALEKCQGDPMRALELLAQGWTPEDQEALSIPGSCASLSSFAGFGPDVPRCPFARAGSDAGAALPPGHPPVSPLAAAVPAPATPSVDDRLANAARALAEQGMQPAQIAPLLGMDEAAVAAVVAQPGAGQGRVLGSDLQRRLDYLLEEVTELCCPVSLMLFVDPVIASDGFMYEKASVDGLLRGHMASPMTREKLKKEFIPARQRKSATSEFRQTRSAELLKFAEEAVAAQPHMAATALQRASDYLEVLRPAQVPGLARQAIDLWTRLGQPVPTALQSFQSAATPSS